MEAIGRMYRILLQTPEDVQTGTVRTVATQIDRLEDAFDCADVIRSQHPDDTVVVDHED